MKRRLEFIKNAGVVLMEVYRIEGTDRLILVITDFGHDYRNSFWAVRPKHVAAMLTQIHEEKFAEEVARLRNAYADEVPASRLTYDAATKTYYVSDEPSESDAHVT